MEESNISILVPFCSDGGSREKNWRWAKRRLEALLPEAEICTGLYEEKPFSRAVAINRAARAASGNLFIIMDADLAFELQDIENSLALLNENTWIVPYINRVALNEEKTGQLLAGNPSVSLKELDITGCPVFQNEAGGISILPRKYFERVNGFDERFNGWGAEDNAFAAALDTLCGFGARPGNSTIWHLYHERSWETTFGSPSYQSNIKLYEKYSDAYGDEAAMKRLVKRLESTRSLRESDGD